MNRDQLVDCCAGALYRAHMERERLTAEETQFYTLTAALHGAPSDVARERIARDVDRARRALPVWEALSISHRLPWLERARPMVHELEMRGLLIPEHATAYRVAIDDPDMRRRYEFKRVEAFSAWAAIHKAARLAVSVDESAGLPVGVAAVPADSVQRESPALIEAVAMFGLAWELDGDGAPVQVPGANAIPADPVPAPEHFRDDGHLKTCGDVGCDARCPRYDGWMDSIEASE